MLRTSKQEKLNYGVSGGLCGRCRLVVIVSQVIMGVGVASIVCFCPWLPYTSYQYVAAAIVIFVSTNVLEGLSKCPPFFFFGSLGFLRTLTLVPNPSVKLPLVYQYALLTRKKQLLNWHHVPVLTCVVPIIPTFYLLLFLVHIKDSIKVQIVWVPVFHSFTKVSVLWA